MLAGITDGIWFGYRAQAETGRETVFFDCPEDFGKFHTVLRENPLYSAHSEAYLD
jgi:hypothetical protein